MTFPLGAAPSYYATCTTPSRNNIFYVGGTAPSITLSQATPNAYSVRDWWGNVVSSGAVSSTTVTPTAPGGGWVPGWYRIYFTGTNTDAVYGPSYGATNFVIIRNDSRFPPNPTTIGSGQGGGEARDMIMKGVLGIGTSRLQISDASNPTFGADSTSGGATAAGFGNDYWRSPLNSSYVDSNRPTRSMMCQFPNRTGDRIQITSGTAGFRIYVKDPTIDGSQVFVKTDPGSSSGTKYTILFPNSSTVVETYDNMATADAAVAAMASSAYVKAFGQGAAAPGTTAATAIGTAYRDGIITAVSSLYANGVTHFEGPANEGTLNAELAHLMRLFQAAVHAGNASAKAIGPCPVEISDNYLLGWENFLAANGGTYCDEISFHAYNSQTNGDINLGRYVIEGFLAKLAAHGLSSKPLWCTESTHVMSSPYGVYHPRRSRVPLLQTLLWEQYGLPRERNLVWYDRAHGFNAYPAWIANGDSATSGSNYIGGSLNPYGVLYRTLAEETFGMPHSQRIDFGHPTANAVFLGSVYQTPSGAGCAVLVSQSYIPSASVTLNVNGTTNPLTVIDGFGNSSSVSVSSGRAVIPVQEIPTYVRLPTGVSVSVYAANDWGHSPGGSISSISTTKTVGGTTASAIADDGFMTNYGANTGVYISPNTLPEAAILQWAAARNVSRVVIFCGPAWQNCSALVDFDVDTWDGSSWTTRKTVTNATPSSFTHGTDSNQAGCKQETYWDEQWIFDVKLDLPISCTGVRVNVRATSCGGEPDTAATSAGGQGNATQHIALEEIAVIPESPVTAFSNVTVRT